MQPSLPAVPQDVTYNHQIQQNMKPSKPFIMPPVRITSPALEGEIESSKSLKEWFKTKETVRGLRFSKQTEEQIDCSYRSITNCTFNHVQFNTCKLKACHLTDVRFENCDLSNISFAESSFFRVEFVACKLVGTNFSETVLNHLSMQDCNARYINLSMSKINQARFSACDLRNSDINDCKLASIAFDNCELIEAEFSHTPLRGIDLSDCHIEGIHVNLPDIKGAIVNTTQAMDLTSLLGLVIKD